MKLRRLFREYPIAGSIIVAALIIGIMKLNGTFMKMLPQGLIREYLIYSINILAAYFVVRLLGYRWIYRRGDAASTAGAGLPQIVFEGFFLAATVYGAITGPGVEWKPLPGILLGFLKLFQIGFLEESIFRGVIANNIGIRYGKNTQGVWFTVFMSGFIFGAMHMTNLTVGISLSSAFAQSVIACILGIYLTAVYLRGGNIWIMVFIHALTDSIGLFDSSFTTAATTDVDAVNSISFRGAAVFLLYFALAAFLLRRSKIQEVFENIQGAAVADESPEN